jgi:hypothetical protein
MPYNEAATVPTPLGPAYESLALFLIDFENGEEMPERVYWATVLHYPVLQVMDPDMWAAHHRIARRMVPRGVSAFLILEDMHRDPPADPVERILRDTDWTATSTETAYEATTGTHAPLRTVLADILNLPVESVTELLDGTYPYRYFQQ